MGRTPTPRALSHEHSAGPERDWRGGLHVLTGVLALAALYFFAARLGLMLAFDAKEVTAVWPPTGIALAAILLFGFRMWPGIALGAFLANFLVGEPLATALGIVAGNTLEALAGAWLLRNLAGFSSRLGRLKDVLAFVFLAALASTALSATIGVTSLCLGGSHLWSRFGALWSLWWLGDASGALLVAPLLLAWSDWPAQHWQGRRLAEAAALLALVALAAALVFGGRLDTTVSHSPLEYVMFPFIIWAALRFGQPGTTAATLVIAGVAVWGTANGLGPFAGGPVQQSLILLQAFMAVLAVTGLLLSAVVTERQQLYEREADFHEEQRGLQEQLEQRAAQLSEAGRHKDEFLAMLAHELRNPLAPIRNALEILKMPGAGPPATAPARDLMERQLQHLVRLVDDLLDVSRINRGKVQLRLQRLELATVVSRAIETARPVIDAHGHQLEVALPAGPVFLEGDLTRLAQVLANLLNNAAKYSDQAGHIWLDAETHGAEVVIRVRDRGIGIRPDLLPKIFEPFVQSERSLERGQGGLGIGLTLVRSLVELHKGTVAAESAGPGKGSIFSIRLPLAPAPAAPDVRVGDAPVPVATPPCRVLVVDDNVDAAQSLAMLLRLSGQDVRVEHNGPAALQAADEYRPRLVLLDIGLPGMSGYEVAALLRQRHHLDGITLVAVTGYGQEDDRRRSREVGFDHHLVKPVEPEALQAILAGIRHLSAAK
ncbi:MAG TPA: MASE1 domain-containing protein [Gemmataceae bacterium]|nr:MASE1 domain-containing protein [Gemmataceae bacterium]